MKVPGPAGLYFMVLPTLVIVLTLENRGAYGEKDHPQTQDPLSECVLSCTAHTYRQLWHRRDTQTVRFHPAGAGELGDHCWSMHIKRGSGERLQNAYIVLPVNTASGSEASPRLQPTVPRQLNELHAHRGLTAVSENCGLRFDVTGPFASSMTSSLTFCAKIMPPGSFVNHLKCPPFLVTVWLREHHSPA